jgi:hypothetical protein
MSVILARPNPRRAFRRYVRLDCQVVRDHDFRLVGDLALDLSEKGMLVRTDARVLTGEEVIVSFRPPKQNWWFDAQATVARVIHCRRPGDTHRAVGLEFTAADSGDVMRLWESLRGLPPPMPLRDPRGSFAVS